VALRYGISPLKTTLCPDEQEERENLRFISSLSLSFTTASAASTCLEVFEIITGFPFLLYLLDAGE
jgi:hypothetical protein